MISLQQYRVSVGGFNSSSHSEAKEASKNMLVKREAGNAISILLIYLMVVIMLGNNQIEVSTKLQYGRSIFNRYQDIESREMHTTVHYQRTSKTLNKMMHIQNGNRREKGCPMTLCYWNKGSAHLENRRESITDLIRDYKPHVLGIGEAQFKTPMI